MATIPPGQRVARAAGLWRRTGDEVLIRRRGHDDVVVLGGTGAALWDALETPIAVGELAERLAASYASPLAMVEPDVVDAVADLVAQQIVTTA